jgi:hypothetical protein
MAREEVKPSRSVELLGMFCHLHLEMTHILRKAGLTTSYKQQTNWGGGGGGGCAWEGQIANVFSVSVRLQSLNE